MFWKLANPIIDRVNPVLSRYCPSRDTITPGAPIVVAGLFRSASGIGEACRTTYYALHEVGLNPIAVDLTSALAKPELQSDIRFSKFPEDQSGTILLHVNAPDVSRALRGLQYLNGRRWRVIGVWAWELPSVPRSWRHAGRLVTEIWTISQFSAEALRGAFPGHKVSWHPLSISPPREIQPFRPQLGIPKNAFVVLTIFDSLSSVERKNPAAAIRAFKLAFADLDECQLVIKARNLDADPNTRAYIDGLIVGEKNILVIDRVLTGSEKWSLMNSVDVFLSLHRAEGFGLGAAEAMALGKPAIATGWSGNMSYMNTESGFLVGYRLIPVYDQFGVYDTNDSEWADPDVEEAGVILKKLYDDRALLEKAGIEAKAAISNTCSAKNIGNQMKESLFANPNNSND